MGGRKPKEGREGQERERGGKEKGRPGKEIIVTSLGPVETQARTPFPGGVPRFCIVLAGTSE